MTGWTVFEIAVDLFQAVLIVYFLKKQLRTARKNIVLDVACILCIASSLTLYAFFDIPIIDTVIFIFPLIYSYIVFDEKWYVVLFWNVVIVLVFIGVANLTTSFYKYVLKSSSEQLMSGTPLHVTFVLSTNLLTLIFVIIITMMKNREGQLPWHSLALLLILNILSIVSIEMLFKMGSTGDVDNYITVTCLCLFAISVLSIILYEVLAENAVRQQRYKLEIEHLKLSQKYNQEMQIVFADMAEFRHDIKHQMQIISQMVLGHDAGEVQNYISLLNDRYNSIQPFSTGSIAVDALLTAKASIMRHRKISFDFHPYPLNKLPVEENDFCTLLGNLLDNAIEGIARLPDADNACISLAIARTWDMLYITCENPYNPITVRCVNNLFASSKDGFYHGIGTRSIEAVARRANGYVHYVQENGVFRVETVLPFEKGGCSND